MRKAHMLKGCLISIVLLLAITGPVSAGLGASGAVFKTEASPGEHVQHEVTVTSDKNDSPLDIEIQISGYGQDITGATFELAADKDKSIYSARSFLKVTPEKFHLEPGTSQTIVIDANVPVDVGSGGRYAMVKVLGMPGKNMTIGIALAINVPVLLTISGSKVDLSGEITNLNTSDPFSNNQKNISLVLKNTGNIHYKALVQATLKDEKGEILANSTSPLSFSSLIPTHSTQFNLVLRSNTTLDSGNYSICATAMLEDGTILATKEASLD